MPTGVFKNGNSGQFKKGHIPSTKGRCKHKTNCLRCGVEIRKDYPAKYCSRSCAAKSRIISEETKRKISLTNKKIKHTKEWNRKVGLANIGSKRSKESIERISKGHLGQKAWNKGIVSEIKGEKHWNWKGGITLKEKRLRQSIKYRDWRSKVFERDLYTCKKCGVCGTYLHAHHIKKFSKYPNLRYDITNGITLCKECHIKTINKEKFFELEFYELIGVI